MEARKMFKYHFYGPDDHNKPVLERVRLAEAHAPNKLGAQNIIWETFPMGGDLYFGTEFVMRIFPKAGN